MMLCEAYLEQGLVVTDIGKLRRNYMFSCQFGLDVISLLPTDLLYLYCRLSPFELHILRASFSVVLSHRSYIYLSPWHWSPCPGH